MRDKADIDQKQHGWVAVKRTFGVNPNSSKSPGELSDWRTSCNLSFLKPLSFSEVAVEDTDC
jgi:hypothetical protein